MVFVCAVLIPVASISLYAAQKKQTNQVNIEISNEVEKKAFFLEKVMTKRLN